MICWSCQKELPHDAKFCPYCEAEFAPEPTAEEQADVANILAEMPPEAASQLLEALNQSATGEEFVNRIMVGDCPQCGSSKTGCCESDPELEDPTLGRCFDCGQMWCIFCGELFKDAQSLLHDDCPGLAEMGFDDDDWEEDFLEEDDSDEDELEETE